MEVKDDPSLPSTTMRLKAWNAQARQLAQLDFMSTYDFINFKCQKNNFDDKLECNWQKGSVVQTPDEQFDPEDEWDEKTYGPLSDIHPSQTENTNLQFIVKFVKAGSKQDDYVKMDFVDEEGTTKTFKVHESWEEHLVKGKLYVAHRVRILEGVGVVDAAALLTPAPRSYEWELH